jgi:hypothetical protein
MLPHDTLRILKHQDCIRVDFSSLHRWSTGGEDQVISRNDNENPFGHDFSLLIRNGQKYPWTKDGRQPSVVLVDWSRMQYVDLLETELESDEHILMIRRLMIHKKMIGSYVR